MEFEFQKLADVQESQSIDNNTTVLVVNDENVEQTKINKISASSYINFTDSYNEYITEHNNVNSPIDYILTLTVAYDNINNVYNGYIDIVNQSSSTDTYLFTISGTVNNPKHYIKKYYKNNNKLCLNILEYNNLNKIEDKLFYIDNSAVFENSSSNLNISGHLDVTDGINSHDDFIVSGASQLNSVEINDYLDVSGKSTFKDDIELEKDDSNIYFTHGGALNIKLYDNILSSLSDTELLTPKIRIKNGPNDDRIITLEKNTNDSILKFKSSVNDSISGYNVTLNNIYTPNSSLNSSSDLYKATNKQYVDNKVISLQNQISNITLARSTIIGGSLTTITVNGVSGGPTYTASTTLPLNIVIFSVMRTGRDDVIFNDVDYEISVGNDNQTIRMSFYDDSMQDEHPVILIKYCEYNLDVGIPELTALRTPFRTIEQYLTDKTYSEGDTVLYQDNGYVCKEDNVSGTWDSSKWQPFTARNSIQDAFNNTIMKSSDNVYNINGIMDLGANRIANVAVDSNPSSTDAANIGYVDSKRLQLDANGILSFG